MPPRANRISRARSLRSRLRRARLPAPAALDTLCADFGLTPFEHDVLLLCAGLELDAGFGPLFAAAHGDPQRPYPTFSLALAALPDPHWSALAPEAALRRWRLIEVGTGSALVFSPLRIDERVLHYLLGVNYLDDRLLGIVDRVHQTAALTPSQEGLAERIAALWSQPARDAALPAVQLCGAETADKRGVAVAACRKLGWDLCVVRAQNLPADPRELEALMRLWEREAILSRAVLLLDCDELDATDAAHTQAVARFVEGVGGLVVLTGRERRALRQRPLISLDVARPTVQEQRMLWQQTLGATAVSLNGHVETLVAQFSLNAAGIRSAAAEITGQSVADESNELDSRLWDACRAQSRPRLDELAHRIPSQARWDDLVLPDLQRQTLRDVVGAGAPPCEGLRAVGLCGQKQSWAGHQRALCGRQRHGQDSGGRSAGE